MRLIFSFFLQKHKKNVFKIELFDFGRRVYVVCVYSSNKKHSLMRRQKKAKQFTRFDQIEVCGLIGSLTLNPPRSYSTIKKTNTCTHAHTHTNETFTSTRTTENFCDRKTGVRVLSGWQR